MYKIRSLQEYNFYEGSMDKGSGVREKSKQVVDLLGNNELIRSEREKARALRNKFVGIDSRNVQGGGGYGGYSGSGGGGGGSSYDSYSGGGGGSGSGGRYDSYDSGSGSGSRYGGDSYSNNSSNTRRASASDNGGRYGGGSYDSEKPPRYGDDVPERSGSRYEDEEEVKPVSRSKSVTASSSSTGGKIKINIKKAESTTTARVEEPNLFEPEIDLMGGFESAPAPAAPASSSMLDFDPFGAAPAPPAAPVNNTSSFDPFGSSSTAFPTSQPAASSNFDPFATAPAPPVPAQNFAQNNFSAFQAAPPVNNNFASYPAANSAPAQAFPSYQGQGYQQAPMMQTQQQPAYAPAPAHVAVNNNRLGSTSFENDFGDFEAAPSNQAQQYQQYQQPQTQQPKAPAPDKWGDLGSLVDLTKIEKNEKAVPKSAAPSTSAHNYSQNSFAGLDGFSRAPQPMVSYIIFSLFISSFYATHHPLLFCRLTNQ